MLYPDRTPIGFLDKNRVDAQALARVPGVELFTQATDSPLLLRDVEGDWRFDASIVNRRALSERLQQLAEELGHPIDAAQQRALFDLYESVFQHRAYTGRSGGMFGFEGLGCIYWHMVSKLLLAVQECYFHALDEQVDPALTRQLGASYYRVRHGLGFNKPPAQYGAIPHDPYSHSPAHAGAQQPGMTGQVKEEILTRFGELGVRIRGGCIAFQPGLLRRREFMETASSFRFVSSTGNPEVLELPARSLAFTYCQVPVVYRLQEAGTAWLSVEVDGAEQRFPGVRTLTASLSELVFQRDGRVSRITLGVPTDELFEAQAGGDA